MPAARKTLVHDAGTTFLLGIVYKDSNKTPVDLTGHRVTFTVYNSDRNGSYSVGNTEAVVDSTGHITIKVPHSETLRWGSGRLSYAVDHQDPAGDVTRMFYGPLDIKGLDV